MRKHFPEDPSRILLSHWINLDHVPMLKPIIDQGNQCRMIAFTSYDSLFGTGSEAYLLWSHGWTREGGYLGKEGKKMFERSWLLGRPVPSPDMLYYAKSLPVFSFCYSVLPLRILVKPSRVGSWLFFTYLSLVLSTKVRNSANIHRENEQLIIP